MHRKISQGPINHPIKDSNNSFLSVVQICSLERNENAEVVVILSDLENTISFLDFQSSTS